ncbi:MAG: hypothetical protein A2W98_11060 [Bacteroidetes bacterium GWF2_33_38]|nr:MAG: hypothetical protein A2W98_11060 [Bacteroidetes bacterium GWF2_33_38]OFY91488.1 MAG: hypothetical protein A2236_05075 [Bacteroidetes bacterium RIFOXYA2_FULL_33_7]
MNNDELLLSVENLSKRFEDKIITQQLSFSVFKGEKVALKGTSGQGKSTILNIILGFGFQDSGTVSFKNRTLSPENINFFRTNIAWLPQSLSLDTKVENVFTNVKNYKNNRVSLDKLDELLLFFNLSKDILKQNFQKLSGGERQRIGIINAMLLNRELMILDEPVSAMDAGIKTKTIDFLFNNPELTILSTSHDEEWLSRCHKIIEI